MNIWFFYICRSFDDKELEIASSKMVKKITIPWWFQNILCVPETSTRFTK